MESLIAMLAAGKSVALVSDAGTPAISDPGARARARGARGGLSRSFRCPARRRWPPPSRRPDSTRNRSHSWASCRSKPRRGANGLPLSRTLPAAIVMYEAPHRVRATVADLAAALGGDRALVVGRELTKTFETITRVPLGRSRRMVCRRSESRARRVRADRRRDAPPRRASRTRRCRADAERWLVALLEELPPARAARVVAAVPASSATRSTRARSRSSPAR